MGVLEIRLDQMRRSDGQLGPFPFMWKDHNDVDRVVSLEWLCRRLNELGLVPNDPPFVLVSYQNRHGERLRCWRPSIMLNPTAGVRAN